MSRPRDWAPVAERDPVPGDPYEVRALARRLRRTADAIKEQTEALQRLCTDEFWDSDAGREFRGTARETATKLDAAYARYDAAAEAVDGYAPALEDAQRSADAALLQAQEADEHRRKAQATVDGFCGPVTAQDPRIVAAQRFADEASQEIDRARSEVDRAVESRHAAARHAATAIRIAIKDDRLTDHRMDHVKQWIHENADWISQLGNIAGWVASACGVLALFVGWIPIAGQALAAVLGAVALAATVVALVCHLALLLSGDGSWIDVALDAVGLLTFGIGRAAVSGLRSSAVGLRLSGKIAAAAEKTCGVVAGRGGHVNKGVRDALFAGKLDVASELSGVAPRTLKGAMGNHWGNLPPVLGAESQREARTMLQELKVQRWFGGELLRDAFNPKVVARETMEALPDAFSLKKWRDSYAMVRDGKSTMGALEHDPGHLLSQLMEVTQPSAMYDAAASYVSMVNTDLRVFQAATFGGLSIDATDKLHLWDPWK